VLPEDRNRLRHMIDSAEAATSRRLQVSDADLGVEQLGQVTQAGHGQGLSSSGKRRCAL